MSEAPPNTVNANDYHTLSKLLHWLIAGLIVLQFVSHELAEYAADSGVPQLGIRAGAQSQVGWHDHSHARIAAADLAVRHSAAGTSRRYGEVAGQCLSGQPLAAVWAAAGNSANRLANVVGGGRIRRLVQGRVFP